MYVLDRFGVDELVSCSADIRAMGQDTADMEETATRITRHLQATLVTAVGGPAVALARFYKTHRLDDLDENLQAFARELHDEALVGDVRCLTLLATAGVEAQWNDRRQSVGHQAIPLAGTTFLSQSPMIATLVADLGIDADFVVRPNPAEVIERHHQDYGVFYVPEAKGSAAVPAQDFVEAYGIRSVIGIGGVLPSGDLFAVVIFATVAVTPGVADLFRSLGLAVKAAVTPHTFTVFSAAT